MEGLGTLLGAHQPSTANGEVALGLPLALGLMNIEIDSTPGSAKVQQAWEGTFPLHCWALWGQT